MSCNKTAGEINDMLIRLHDHQEEIKGAFACMAP